MRLTTEQLASHLGISSRQVQRLASLGLPSIPVGARGRRYDPEAYKCVFVESDPETLLGQSAVSELEMYGRPSNPEAATRRAIVRAAAEIGRAMS